MNDLQTHAYTQAVLGAWRRFDAGETKATGPSTDDYPGLVERLFVLNRFSDKDFSFRRVGPGIEKVFGRELTDHNFLSLWAESDRPLVVVAAEAAVADHGPVIINARGNRLDGKFVEIEFTLAPIRDAGGRVSKFLGLCQFLTAEPAETIRPLRQLRAIAVYPPAPRPRRPVLRLVASNP